MSTSESVAQESPVAGDIPDVQESAAVADDLETKAVVADEPKLEAASDETCKAAAPTETAPEPQVEKAAPAAPETYMPPNQHKLVKRPPGGGSSIIFG